MFHIYQYYYFIQLHHTFHITITIIIIIIIIYILYYCLGKLVYQYRYRLHFNNNLNKLIINFHRMGLYMFSFIKYLYYL
jgi:hypothetical protein